jgi:hypothetical protein
MFTASTLRAGQLEAQASHGMPASNSVQLKSTESLFLQAPAIHCSFAEAGRLDSLHPGRICLGCVALAFFATVNDVPRAYDTALTAQMKKTLREAEQQMAHGRRAVLAKKGEGKDSGARADDALAIGQGESSYVLDENALTELPKKE